MEWEESYTPKSVFLEENKDDLDEEEIKSIMEQRRTRL